MISQQHLLRSLKSCNKEILKTLHKGLQIHKQQEMRVNQIDLLRFKANQHKDRLINFAFKNCKVKLRC